VARFSWPRRIFYSAELIQFGLEDFSCSIRENDYENWQMRSGFFNCNLPVVDNPACWLDLPNRTIHH
jgi:hypothetical protein